MLNKWCGDHICELNECECVSNLHFCLHLGLIQYLILKNQAILINLPIIVRKSKLIYNLLLILARGDLKKILMIPNCFCLIKLFIKCTLLMFKLKIFLFTKYLIFQIIKINRVIILGVEILHK